MLTRIGFAPRRAGLSIEAMQAHWRTRHAEVAGALPGLKRYWQAHAVLENGYPLLPWAGFDCCSELDYESIAEMDRSFCSDHYFSDVRPDEAQLIDKARGGAMTTRRHILDGAVDPGKIRLMIFMRAAPQRRADQLADAVGALSKATGSCAREMFVALEGSAAAQRVSLYDLVESHWFESADRALAFARSGEQAARRGAIAQLVRGTDYLIAATHIVL